MGAVLVENVDRRFLNFFLTVLVSYGYKVSLSEGRVGIAISGIKLKG